MIADCLGGEQGAAELLRSAAIALENSIATRVQGSFVSYASMILSLVHAAQTDERHRIARELHDRVGSAITVGHRQLELHRRLQHTDAHRAGRAVHAAQRAITESERMLREVVSDLYAVSEYRSLDPALRNYLESVGSENVDVRIRINGDESWAGPEVIDESFLVLREAVRNALTHAAPFHIAVNVDITPLELHALVVDDGRGFEVPERPDFGGAGIASMRERVRLLGGVLHLRSTVGWGTQVDFYVPLSPEAGHGGAL